MNRKPQSAEKMICVYNKAGKDLPENWAEDSSGVPTVNAGEVLTNIVNKAGGQGQR